jgi:hypothetical protein
MADSYAFIALAPVFGLALFFVVHTAVCRSVASWARYPAIIAGFAAGLVGTEAATLAGLMHRGTTAGDLVAQSLLNCTIYLAFSSGYFNFVNLNITSLRIRMLQEILAAGGRVPIANLQSCYNTDEVASLRVDRLSRNGDLLERDGRFYRGKSRFLIVANIFESWRWFIYGRGQR